METIETGTAAAPEIAALVRATFTASEGPEEGDLVGAFAAALMAETAPQDLHAFTAWDGTQPVGACFFSRMVYAGDPRTVFILSPVAVAPERQGAGVGQRLLRHGLGVLKAEGVDVALTYGDPAYYGKVGFRPVSVEEVPAPHRLQFPEGWLAQTLDESPLAPFSGPVRCVAALNRPELW